MLQVLEGVDNDFVRRILGVEPAGDSEEGRSLTSGDGDLKRRRRNVSTAGARDSDLTVQILTAEPVMKPVRRREQEGRRRRAVRRGGEGKDGAKTRLEKRAHQQQQERG